MNSPSPTKSEHHAEQESTVTRSSDGEATPNGSSASTAKAPVERLAALFARGTHGYASLPTSVSASLRRLDVNRPARGIDAVIGALVAAEIPVERLDDDQIVRWASIVHGIAVLSGTAGTHVHKRSSAAGKAIASSGYSSARFARLLTAQGSALPPQITRLTRFLAAARAVPLDLRPIAELVLWDGRDATRADAARLTLARGYYTGTSSTKSSG